MDIGVLTVRCPQAAKDFRTQMEECKILDTLNKSKEKDSGFMRDLAFAVESLGRPGIGRDNAALKAVSESTSCGASDSVFCSP